MNVYYFLISVHFIWSCAVLCVLVIRLKLKTKKVWDKNCLEMTICTLYYSTFKLVVKLHFAQSWHHHQSNFDLGNYPFKQGWLDLPHSNSNVSNSHSPSRLIQGILLLQTKHFCFPSPLASSTSSLVVLASSCPSLQTPTLFSKFYC